MKEGGEEKGEKVIEKKVGRRRERRLLKEGGKEKGEKVIERRRGGEGREGY